MTETLTFNIGEAKTKLSQLVALAERGNDVVIARAGEPAVRLTPVEPLRPVFGFAPYYGEPSDSLLEPMSAEEISLWEDGPVFPEDN